MKTKYIKVPVSERLPKTGLEVIFIYENGSVTTGYVSEKGNLWTADILEMSTDIKYWLEEVPDREEEMIGMLQWVLSASEPHNELSSDIQNEIKKLIQEIKQ